MNYFEKKQWIRLGICAVLLIAASLFLTGIIGGFRAATPSVCPPSALPPVGR